MAVNLDEIVHLAEQLSPDQQNRLIYRLRVKQVESRTETEAPASEPHPADNWFLERGSEYVEDYRSPTREELLDDVRTLYTTPPKPDDQLLGKYANPAVSPVSEEELHAELHAIATEWEEELDEFSNDAP